MLKRCKTKKAAREGGKRERKMNEGTKRREDVDVVIVTEKRVVTCWKNAGRGEKKWKSRMDEGD